MAKHSEDRPHANEIIKKNSQFLRGTLRESIADPVTGALPEADQQISKFHGFYQQDDRDRRQERASLKLEPLYRLMLRARLPGGVCSPQQWLTLDSVGRELANGTLRLTTRQTFQYHGILKKDIKQVIQSINFAKIDSIGGCGDVNRNIVCASNPSSPPLHQVVYRYAKRMSEHLLPKTRAYYELWLDEEKIESSEEREPLYGNSYLPRKFKTAFAIPPFNDVDVFANDMGFVAIVEDKKLQGFNVLAGGGMGAVHRDSTTYPRLARVLGYVEAQDIFKVAEAIVTVQRDFGNRIERKHARLKYTLEKMGLSAFKQEVQQRSGVVFSPQRPFAFSTNVDRIGWTQAEDDLWHLTLYVQNGRLSDQAGDKSLTGVRKIAEEHRGEFRITANQNLMIANIPRSQKKFIEDIALQYSLLNDKLSKTQAAAVACVALPTCPLAMAEAERYVNDFIRKIDALMTKHGLNEQQIAVRMSGCPNGCSRPYLAEMGLVGKAPGRYNLFLGGDSRGGRLNRLYLENVREQEILAAIDKLFDGYASQRQERESFGDYCVRAGIVRKIENTEEKARD